MFTWGGGPLCDSKLGINIKKLQKRFVVEMDVFEKENETLKRLNSLIEHRDKLNNELKALNNSIYRKLKTEGLTEEVINACKNLRNKIENLISEINVTEFLE